MLSFRRRLRRQSTSRRRAASQNTPVQSNTITPGDQLAIRDRRWSRLEKLRRREEAERQGCGSDGAGVDGGEEDNHADSTESSVEGIYVQGVRSSHPFQVIQELYIIFKDLL